MNQRLIGFALGLLAAGCTTDQDSEAGRSVRYAGGATTDFGSGINTPGCQYGDPVDITQEEFVALGYDPKTMRATVEGTRSAELLWYDCSAYGKNCPATEIEVTTKVLDYYKRPFTHFTPMNSEDVPDCFEATVGVRASVTLKTSDGSLVGAFYGGLVPYSDKAGNGEVYWKGGGTSDLRNFYGELELPVDVERPHWSYLGASLDYGKTFAGSIYYSVYYTDSDARDMRYASLATWPADSVSADSLPEGPKPVPEEGSPWATLNDYEGSRVPPMTDPLEVCLRGTNQSSPIDVTVIVDGKETVTIALAVRDCVDIGAFPRDTHITVAAVKSNTGSSLELVIGNGCLDAAAATTEGSGDEVRVDYVTGFIGCYN